VGIDSTAPRAGAGAISADIDKTGVTLWADSPCCVDQK
jgi:hypothetical protein